MTISAKVIADSIGEHAPRLVTMLWRYPKFIHGEAKTHRVMRIANRAYESLEEVGVMDDVNLSRNASSSRAIPVERLIKDVIDDPVYPMHWGKNQPGMSADEECFAPIEWIDPLTQQPWSTTREACWVMAREAAIHYAKAFSKAGYHKQIVNRLLEPFCHINVVVTATEWSNFFALRDHPGAQPEIRLLAQAAKKAMAESTPNLLNHNQWHTPFANFGSLNSDECWDEAIKVSVARCARTSYLTHEGKTPDIDSDLKLYDKLVGSVPLHASPAEHQARPDHWIDDADRPRWRDPKLHGNLKGWVQFRKTLPGENQ